MGTAIVATYYFVDDWLHVRRHQESAQRSVGDAEVMTAAITAARFFGGNFEKGLDLLAQPRYFGRRLSPSRFSRRLHRLVFLLESFFDCPARCRCQRIIAPPRTCSTP